MAPAPASASSTSTARWWTPTTTTRSPGTDPFAGTTWCSRVADPRQSAGRRPDRGRGGRRGGRARARRRHPRRETVVATPSSSRMVRPLGGGAGADRDLKRDGRQVVLADFGQAPPGRALPGPADARELGRRLDHVGRRRANQARADRSSSTRGGSNGDAQSWWATPPGTAGRGGPASRHSRCSTGGFSRRTFDACALSVFARSPSCASACAPRRLGMRRAWESRQDHSRVKQAAGDLATTPRFARGE